MAFKEYEVLIENSSEQDNSNVKAYSFMFVHYGNPCLILDNISNIRHTFSIYHDKDTNEKGEKVIPHYHTIVVFANPRHLSSMRKIAKSLYLSSGFSFFVEPCHSLAKASEYALHRTAECLEDPNKHLYQYRDAICDNDAFWHKVIDGSDDAFNEEFVRDLITLTPLKMSYKYGKEFIRNHKSYLDFRNTILHLYAGDLSRLMEDIDFEGDKTNFKSILNNYYIMKE